MQSAHCWFESLFFWDKSDASLRLPAAVQYLALFGKHFTDIFFHRSFLPLRLPLPCLLPLFPKIHAVCGTDLCIRGLSWLELFQWPDMWAPCWMAWHISRIVLPTAGISCFRTTHTFLWQIYLSMGLQTWCSSGMSVIVRDCESFADIMFHRRSIGQSSSKVNQESWAGSRKTRGRHRTAYGEPLTFHGSQI